MQFAINTTELMQHTMSRNRRRRNYQFVGNIVIVKRDDAKLSVRRKNGNGYFQVRCSWGKSVDAALKIQNFIGGEVSNATRYEANKQIRQIGDAAVLDPHFE
jgi:hypothetical protein